jgi:hemerythrin-like domain-containing protein
MLKVMEAMAQRLAAGENVAIQDLAEVLEFLQVFADKCHHGKEEGWLFPAMVAGGFPKEGGPLSVMLADHDTGRSYLREIKAAVEDYQKGDSSLVPKLAQNLRQYVALLTEHIDKEDKILYPLADEVLTPAKQRELVAAFEKLEIDKIGEGQHEEFHRLLERLEGVYLVGK